MAHILVIDGEREICRLIEKTLGRDGHTVTAKNSAVGLDAADLKQYDLLILDVMMPGIDGFSFCYQIRGAVDCPILFLTAKAMEQDIVEGFAMGADDYIKSPLASRNFAQGWRRICGGRSESTIRRSPSLRFILICLPG